jgi:hypothetical protein
MPASSSNRSGRATELSWLGARKRDARPLARATHADFLPLLRMVIESILRTDAACQRRKGRAMGRRRPETFFAFTSDHAPLGLRRPRALLAYACVRACVLRCPQQELGATAAAGHLALRGGAQPGVLRGHHQRRPQAQVLVMWSSAQPSERSLGEKDAAFRSTEALYRPCLLHPAPCCLFL